MLLWIGVGIVLLGVAVILSLLLKDQEKAEEKQLEKEKKAKQEAAFKELKEVITKGREEKDKKSAEAKRGKKGGLYDPERLAFAEIETPPATLRLWVVVSTLLLTVASIALGFFLPFGWLLIFLPSLALRYNVSRRVKKKQKAFGGQLGQALQVISSALSAGQSLNIAFTSVADEAEEPMKTEVSRILNESRLGRDVVAAMMDSAERMKSEDFEWFASAVDLQRRTGGNLVEIIETVSETVRERFELREKIRAYSAEGRLQAYVLMALPLVIGALFQIMNPDYMAPLFASPLGWFLLGVSAIMYGIAYFWMSKIVAVKI